MARLALLTLAVLAAGCPAGDGTAGPRSDAGAGDGGTDGRAVIAGRVCVLSDLRRLAGAAPGDCAATGAGGIQVVLGGSAPAITAGDGSFTIPAQDGTNLAWRVRRLDLVTSIVPVSASALLPAMREADYGDLRTANGVILDPGDGAIVARILRGGVPVTGATAEVAGGESLQTLYDGGNATVWATLATGALGVAWLPDNAAGARTLRVAQGATQVAVPVSIVDQAITFVTIALP